MRKDEKREKVFERDLSKWINDNGGWSIKLSSALIKGLPDRLVLIPGGRVMFIEFKSSGKRPTTIQKLIHEKLRKFGFIVLVVDCYEDCEMIKYYFGT